MKFNKDISDVLVKVMLFIFLTFDSKEMGLWLVAFCSLLTVKR